MFLLKKEKLGFETMSIESVLSVVNVKYIIEKSE